MPFALSSPAFPAKRPIPEAHAQAGENRSPSLRWHDAPAETKSFVLVVEDHNAPVGTVTHWVVFDIPPDSDGLLEGLENAKARQGVNDMGHDRYDGPKPPKGHGPHKYHFRLTALDTPSLSLPHGPASNSVKKAARSHVLVKTELVGIFETK